MTSQYKTYPRYKDSGTKWIGEIPEGWEVDKVKHYKKDVKFSIVDGPFGTQLHSEEYVDEGIPVVRVINLTYNGDFVSKNMVFIRKEKYSELKRSSIKEGDILIAKTGATIGKIGVFSGFKKAIISSSCLKLSLKDKINHDFFKYLLISDSGQSQILSEAAGSTRDTINIDPFSNLCFSIPNKIEEQQKIASFLDKKTAKIDALIEKDKLKEKRAALINHAVTKGLDPNVKMKDSGIDWIGEIPEGWKIRKIKHLTENFDGKRIPISAEKRENGKIPYYGATGVLDYVKDFIFNEELLLVGEDGAPFFEPFKDVAYIIDGKSWVNNHAHVLRVIGNNVIKWLCYYLNIYDYGAVIKGSTRDKLNQDQLSNMFVVKPSIKEQTTIVNFLDKATTIIDRTIKKIEEKIKFLEEYKKSLIHHTVTGKIDVRGLEY